LFVLTFDSGRTVNVNGVFSRDGASEANIPNHRYIYDFKDFLSRRGFDVEVIFEGGVASVILLYPIDANKGGFDTPREKMEAAAKEIKGWLEKQIIESGGKNILIHGEFDPRSWMVYATLGNL